MSGSVFYNKIASSCQSKKTMATGLMESFWTTRFLLVLMFFNYDETLTVVGKVGLGDLQIVCMYGFRSEFSDNNIPPNGFCSAMGTYEKYPPPPQRDIKSLTLGLPYVYVHNIKLVEYASKPIFFYDPLPLLDEIKKIIGEQNVDVLIVDFLDRDLATEIPVNVDTQIQSLFEALKKFRIGLLIGLMLPFSRPNSLENRLKDLLRPINLIDLYLVKSYDYQPCRMHNHQNEMAGPPTDTDFKNTIITLQSLDYPVAITFFTLELVVKSWKNDDSFYYDEWSYTYMCGAKPGKRRKYCTQSLESIYSQIKFIYESNLGGVFVKAVDYDDWNNTCGCGKFPALQLIAGEFKNDPKNVNITGCTTYGLKDQNHE